MRCLTLFVMFNCVLFALASATQVTGMWSVETVAAAGEKTPDKKQFSKAAAVLRDYMMSHKSLTGHADPRPIFKNGDVANTKRRSPGLIKIAENSNVTELKIPSANDKAKTGQTDDLLVPIEKDKGSRTKDYKEPGASTSITDDRSDSKGAAVTADEDHLKLFVENRYPSAATCGVCHPKHYKEWSVSQHAYAQLSPVYLSLNNRINQLSNGSNGDFCLRCHSPVGANLGESPFMSNLDRHPTSREGITCVVCHRINKAYNKASGRLALVEGGLTDPVFGPDGNKGVKDVLSKPEKYRVVTKEKEPGRKIHKSAKLFDSIKTPVFCGTCHDVTLFNGFRLEEAYSEYRVSPAAAKGITCQDCHMGKIQGKPSGYEQGPAAIVGDVPTKKRKLTSHLFSGPDFSVVHPGIFPHNEKAAAFKTMREWLQFKHKEGWGTDKFEDNVPKGYKFPKAWASVDDRYDAREILNKQFKLLDFARIKRLEVLKNGFVLGRIIPDKGGQNGLSFRVQVRNGTDGHNVPTGFTGERLIWLAVTVRDRNGKVLFRSGDRDPNGDLRDGHSSYVRAGKIALDRQLFSLQSIFVTQNGRGGEIEHVIPIPFPTFALPRVLPSTTSLVFTGEPATERNHKKGIEPNGERWAAYTIGANNLTGEGPYEATVQLKAQPVPINLIVASQKVGFDFGMTPAQLGKEILSGTQTLWEKKVVLGKAATGNREVLPWQRGASRNGQ
ncbi:MAG: multiheme c-type cytochrome [Hyphomicrobiaceae bacterium]